MSHSITNPLATPGRGQSQRGTTPTRSFKPGGDKSKNTGKPLDINPEKELEILEKLIAGNFDVTKGLEQFLQEDTGSASSTPRSAGRSQGTSGVVHNLEGDFASMESLSGCPAVKAHGGKSYTSATTEPEEEHSEPIFKYIKDFLKAVDDNEKIKKRVVNALLAQRMAALCPENPYLQMKDKLEKLATVLQSFMNTHSVNELCTMFTSKTSPRKGTIRLSLAKQDAFVQTVSELNENLQALDTILKKLDQEGLKTSIGESLDKYERDIEEDGAEWKQFVELMGTIKSCYDMWCTFIKNPSGI